MGIKFRCPNGHKLNVKIHQAGKKGYCPKCDIAIEIPLKSQRKGKAERAAERQAAPAQVATGAMTDQATTVPAPSMPVATRIIPSTDIPTAILPVVPSTAPDDPLATNPDLVWYVRPTNGNQFGPAKGALFQSWIQEGRVSPESLVWQEGWEDWKSASEIFPQLASPPPAQESITPLAEDTDALNLNFDSHNGGIVAHTNSTAKRIGSRRRTTNSTAIVVSFLAVLALILISVLWWVLNPK